MIRQPIVVLCGHVDHGKSSILEKVKGISITRGEAGGITQTIKSYNVPLENIKKTCGKLLDSMKSKVELPGLMFLDTPGHAAFGNLRKRGGSLADIAILVIDINEGIKPQTIESIEILRESKTPFIIALNKIDKISGWNVQNNKFLLDNISSQSDNTKKILDEKLYSLVGDLYSNFNLNAERFDRVDDFTKTLAIVPLSAKTLEGLPELLMIITGLAQRFLEKSLNVNVGGIAKATVLEIHEEKGMGKVLDAVVYDGVLKVGDKIILGSMKEFVETKVKGLFVLGKTKLESVKEVHAASSVIVSASDIDEVIAGMPLRVIDQKNIENIKKEIRDEIKQITFEIDEDGVVIKADTIGSLEALITMLKEKGHNISRASIGNITKKDIVEADSSRESFNKVILGFNVGCLEKSDSVKIILNPVIYKLVDDYETWKEEEEKRIEKNKLKNITRPCKFKVLEGFIFRQSNPAVVGIEVLLGTLSRGIHYFKEEKALGEIKDIQKDGKTVHEAQKGEEVAISLPGITAGRQIKEGDILYSDVKESEFRELKKLKKYLNEDEIQVLKEIAAIRRRDKPVWGI